MVKFIEKIERKISNDYMVSYERICTVKKIIRDLENIWQAVQCSNCTAFFIIIIIC
ncbi:hypothetical protein [Clostridium sp.]|uniref:hypothetical protein n=1 Tax=Clostridium sp. TaxID=1506 RepID=UPI002FC8FCF4